MSDDPEGLVTFTADGTRYTAVFGMRAIKSTERHFGEDGAPKPFLVAVSEIMPSLAPEDMKDKAKVAAAVMRVRFTDLAKLFEFALSKHHEATEEDVEDIMDEIGMEEATKIISSTVSAALAKEGDSTSKTGPRTKRPRRPTG